MKETGPEAMLPTPWRARPEGGEGAGDPVLDQPHDKTVEEGDIALRADAGLDAPARQELEVLEDAVEALGPEGLGVFGLHGGKRGRHPPPGLGDRVLLAIAVTMAILGAPYVTGDVCTWHRRQSRAAVWSKAWLMPVPRSLRTQTVSLLQQSVVCQAPPLTSVKA
jgi:hypothetical protein